MHYDGYRYEETICHMCEAMWTVTAQQLTEVNSNSGVWHGSIQIPTFYVQANSEKEAISKAAEILNAADSKKAFVVDVCRP